MHRLILAISIAVLVPMTSGAATDRERSFAICLTITPGLGAASLGHPGRGAANFALYTGGTGLFAYGATSVDEKGRSDGGLMALGGAVVLGSYIWAFVDAISLEPSEEFTYARPIPKEWRPGQDPPTARPTPLPESTGDMPRNTPDEVRLPVPAPTPKPLEPHVPDPSGSVFIKTQSAGLQQVEVGRYVRAIRTDGSDVVGTIREVSAVAIVLDPGDGSAVMIRATELRQVNAARKP